MPSLRAQAEAVWRHRAAGWTLDRVAATVGCSRTQASYLAMLATLAPDAWAAVDHLHAKAVAALAHLPPDAQHAVLADPSAPQPLTATWLEQRARAVAGPTRPAQPHSRSAPAETDAVAALRAEKAQLQGEIARLERLLGRRRTGLEFAVAARRLAADVTELEALLSGTLDGLFPPDVVRWRSLAQRAVDCFDAALDRLRVGDGVEWWVPSDPLS